MKKILEKLGLVLLGLGPAMYLAVIIIAIFLGRRNLGETLGKIGLAGLVIVFLGLALMITSRFLGKFTKT